MIKKGLKKVPEEKIPHKCLSIIISKRKYKN